MESKDDTNKAERALRNLAIHQGVAYRQYGDALQRFGGREIGVVDFLKAAGDIYIAESGRVVETLAQFGAGLYELALDAAGARPLTATEPEKPTGKPARTGR